MLYLISHLFHLYSRILDLSIGEKKNKETISDVNLNAGFKLLTWNQNVWSKCHKLNEENAKLAEKVASQIEDLELRSSRNKNSAKEFESICDILPQLEESISTVEGDLISLRQNVLNVEKVLDELKMKKELENFIQFKVDQKVRLSRYKDSKLAEFESLKCRLAADHAKKIANYEKLELLKLKEKQLVYQAAFEEDLNFYKTHGMVTSKKDKQPKVKSLEEVEVEPDEEDKRALDQFLDDIRHSVR